MRSTQGTGAGRRRPGAAAGRRTSMPARGWELLGQAPAGGGAAYPDMRRAAARPTPGTGADGSART